MRSWPVRLAITLLVPIALYAVNRYVHVAGVEPFLAGLFPVLPVNAFGHAASGVFALGVMPAITAYAIVELVASLVPRWNRLRHGDPRGRTNLERVARLIAVLLAAMQGFAIGRQLAALADSPYSDLPAPSVGMVTATLVGGACVMMIAADWISRQGIANGYVLLVVGRQLVDLEESIRTGMKEADRVGTLHPIQHLWLVLGMGLAILATVVVLRGANDVRVGKKEEGDAPYRKASALAVHPWLPLPLSSFAPYPIAVSVLGLPPLLGVHAFDTLSNTSFWAVLFATVAVLAILLARLLHRPNELSEIAARLGVSTSKRDHARSRAMLPTILFFLVLLVGSAVANGARYARPGIMMFPLLVALVLDMIAALKSPDLVPVWRDRRASVVPVVRAVLEAEGIAVRTRGLATLSLLQVFAPYAPATLVVPEAEAERATALLRHVFLGEEKPAAVPVAETKKVANVARTRRTSRILGIAAAGGIALVAAMPMLDMTKKIPPQPRRELTLLLVDDEDTTLERIADDALPAHGELRWENTPRGPGRSGKTYYVRVVAQPGETPDAVFASATAWAKKIAVPADRRIVWEEELEFDDERSKTTFTGVRSVVVTGAPILTTADLVTAEATVSTGGNRPEAYVAIQLSDAAAGRFADATGAHIDERIAILLDDRVNSAPVVKSRISGGRMSVTMGNASDPKEQLEKAKLLAASLVGPRP